MTYLILAVILIAVIFVVYLYNGLVTLNNKVKEGWADIETQLKRRYDLIPNLVETVKGYSGFEASTLAKVTEMRTKAMQSTSLAEKAESENGLSETLKSLFAVAENYPDLKANQNYLELQKTLKEVEEHLQLARRYYNGTVRDFNTKIEVFPNNMLASKLGFAKAEFFETKDEAEKENVKVDFSEQKSTVTEVQPAVEPEPTPEPEVPAVEPEPTPEPEAPAVEPEPTPAPEMPVVEPEPTPAPEIPAVEPEPAPVPTEETPPQPLQ